MKPALLSLALFVLLGCTPGNIQPKYSLTTGELERLYSTDRANADRTYTRENVKVTGVIGAIEPTGEAGSQLITFRSAGTLDVLCRVDPPNVEKLKGLGPGSQISVLAFNAGVEDRWIRLFDCVIAN